MSGVNLDGMNDFMEELSALADKVSDDQMAEYLKAGADAFVQDMHKLPSPRSRRSKRSHMLDNISAKKNGSGWDIGWGDYYGSMVEKGTSKMRAQPHLLTTWQQNENKYMQQIQEKIFGGR